MIQYNIDNIPYFPDYETRKNATNNSVYFLTKVRVCELQRWYAVPVLWTGITNDETTEEDIMKNFLRLVYSVVIGYQVGKFDKVDTLQISERERLCISKQA